MPSPLSSHTNSRGSFWPRWSNQPAALNAGIRAAKHDVLVLLDGDTIFEPETIGELVQPFADSRVGAVSGNAKVGNRKGLLGRWQHLEYCAGSNLDRQILHALRCISTVPGAIGAFRKAALTDVGGVSDDTLAEDTCRAIAREIETEFAPCRIAIAHRRGRLVPGDIAVVVAAAAPHRAAAIEACRQGIERVKARGWHVQLFTSLAMISAIRDLAAASPVPVVFDHFGGAQAELGVAQPGFSV